MRPRRLLTPEGQSIKDPKALATLRVSGFRAAPMKRLHGSVHWKEHKEGVASMGVAAAPVVLLGQNSQTLALRAHLIQQGFPVLRPSQVINGRFEELSLVSMCSSVFGLFTALKELEPAIQNGTLPIRLITVLPSHSTQYDAENQKTTIPEHPQLILNGGALKGLTKSICKEWSTDAGVVQGTCLQSPGPP